MSNSFAYIIAIDIDAGASEVRVLRREATRAQLESDPSFSPHGIRHWSARQIAARDTRSVQIRNRKSGQLTSAYVCEMEDA